ncbi:UDP:flavonoid glycosyltransferase YjiC (YdhE family) [Allocatelliglobosispora scoriae]|uniref:UDP:flavonoid glycosyltransferase YjiC (YdhE family) n=1 Tax=Allocatelliglobosispora scoriae TaxID=643052 RepID=A0A841C4L4_9ACTN|nr:nucleotide disphospho-sugar-binding domain-containing protein [Allocatelliglobosispora scoriae]MBB5873910.1 UDP:flavonoid glycosyltransferase YjiC (YdhE family) [Allocatelliglobosispora scoriae]
MTGPVRRSRMILITHGTNGDVLPFLKLATVLRERGHDVTLISHAVFGAAAAATGAEFVPLDTEAEYTRYLDDARDVLLARQGNPSPPDLLAHYERTGWFEHIRFAIRAAADRFEKGGTVIVGRHTSGLAALIAAEFLGAPAAWVALTPAQHLLLPITEYLHRTALAAPLNALRDEFGLGPVTDWSAWLRSADSHLGLWPEWFERSGTATPAEVVRTGFVLAGDAESGAFPDGLAELLDAEQAPVLIAGSSGTILFDEFYEAAVHACQVAGRQAILVSPFPELLPERLPDGVHWFSRLPYREVMPRVAAVIHHGGIGTLGRALVSGVPQLVLAHSFDQPDTGARLRRLGVAEWLPSTQWDPAQAAVLLKQLLGDPAYARRAARLGATIDADRSAHRVAAELEALL